MKLAKFICWCFLIFKTSNSQDYSGDEELTTNSIITTTSEDPIFARCKYLNEVRANYTICCKYPGLVIWSDNYDACKEDCKGKDKEENSCCMSICTFEKLGVLQFNPDDPSHFDVDVEGLIYSFLLSVGNDTIWEPVVRSSTRRCEADNYDVGKGYDCEKIPVALYDIIDCAYIENYLKCPVYNPQQLNQCEFTRQFVEECTGVMKVSADDYYDEQEKS